MMECRSREWAAIEYAATSSIASPGKRNDASASKCAKEMHIATVAIATGAVLRSASVAAIIADHHQSGCPTSPMRIQTRIAASATSMSPRHPRPQFSLIHQA